MQPVRRNTRRRLQRNSQPVDCTGEPPEDCRTRSRGAARCRSQVSGPGPPRINHELVSGRDSGIAPVAVPKSDPDRRRNQLQGDTPSTIRPDSRCEKKPGKRSLVGLLHASSNLLWRFTRQSSKLPGEYPATKAGSNKRTVKDQSARLWKAPQAFFPWFPSRIF